MNEISLSGDLGVIEDEIAYFLHNTQRSLWEVGRRFKYVKDNDLTHGEFMIWYENLGFSKNFVSDAIKIAEEFPNFPTLGNFRSTTALRLASHLPKEIREKEHMTPDGSVKKIEEMTVREIEHLKKVNAEQEGRLRQQEQKIKELSQQVPTVVTKEKIVEKEVPPHDYDNLKSDNLQLQEALKETQRASQSLQERNRFIESQYKEMLAAREEVNQKAAEYQQLQENMARLRGQMTKDQEALTAQKNIAEMIRDANKILDHLAPIAYIDDLKRFDRDDYVVQEVKNVAHRLSRLANDLTKVVGQATIIEGEIINE